MTTITRSERLRQWMCRHNISMAALARQANVTVTTARSWVERETIPADRHELLLSLGFPRELLPLPRGSAGAAHRPVQPDFPGLREGAGA